MKSLEIQLLKFWTLCQARNEGSMTPCQYARIASTIRERNLLVFGSGMDATFWEAVAGRLAIVEDDPVWADFGGIETISVNYRGSVGRSLDNPGAVLEQIAHVGLGWNGVLVDAPKGYAPEHPGREESIYAAAMVRARSGSAVFVHDYEREWERLCCDKFLGDPDEILVSEISGDRRVLAIWSEIFQ